MLLNQDILVSDARLYKAMFCPSSLMEEKTRYSLRIKPKDIAAFKKESGLKLPA